MRRVRRIGRRHSSRHFRRGGDTICAGISRRSSAATAKTSTPACVPTIARPFRICCSRRSRQNGAGGRRARSARCATRPTARRQAFWICMPRATSRKRRAPRSSASSGRPRPHTLPDGRSSRPKRPRGSGSTFAPRSRTSAPRSIDSSSQASTTSSTTARPTRRYREPWPGWLFYAAVEFSPQNAWWDDFGALNGYVARVQSFLQTGAPDQDVLLYYPFYESLAVRGDALLTHFGGASPPAHGTTFEEAAGPAPRRRVHVRLHIRPADPWSAR